MRRLIAKEILAARWLIGLAAAGSALMILLGDPLFFRGESMSDWLHWLTLPFMIMGLGAYSGELANDTVTFLYSRPIKWWQVWLSKAIAGVLAALFVTLAGAVAYMLVVPEVYRPFLASGLLHGIPRAVGVMVLGYGIGFAVSVLLPGIALSFGSLIAVMLCLAGVGRAINSLGRTMGYSVVSGILEANLLLVVLVTGLVATIVVARKLPKFSAKARWLRWSTVSALGIPVAILLTIYGGILHPALSFVGALDRLQAYDVSPDGRWIVYGVGGSDKETYQLLLLDTVTGESRFISEERSLKQLTGPREVTTMHGLQLFWKMAWSPDSRQFAYISPDAWLNVVQVNGDLTPRRVAKTGIDPGGAEYWWEWQSSIWMLWDSEARRVAVYYDPSYRGTGSRWLASVDIVGGEISASDEPAKMYKMDEALTMLTPRPVMLNSGSLFWSPGWESLAEVQKLTPPEPCVVPGGG